MFVAYKNKGQTFFFHICEETVQNALYLSKYTYIYVELTYTMSSTCTSVPM